MDGQGAQFVYLALAGAYILVVLTRRLQGRSLSWKVGAGAAWIAIFAGLFLVADRMGWRLR